MKNRKNNQGSTIIMVLIMCSFIMIIATAITITTMTCLKMKIANRESKKSFYTSEEAVDEVYASLGKISIECFNKAYEEELSNITTAVEIKAGVPITKSKINNDTANKQLREKYTLELLESLSLKNPSVTKLLDANNQISTGLMIEKPEEQLVTNANTYLENSNIKIKAVENVSIEIRPTYEVNGGTGYDTYYLKFKDMNVTFVTAAGYYSDITFSGEIGMPDVLINFVDEDTTGTLNFDEYCLIGNTGVTVEKSSAIKGNTYAGGGSNGGFKVLDNVNMSFSGNKLLCRGTVYSLGGTLNVNGSDVWAEDIVVGSPSKSGTLNSSNANLYVKDDLTVEGDNSTVDISGGKYYGYTYDYMHNKSGTIADGAGGTLKPEQSSSVIVNGFKSKIDFKGTDVNISGRAYITFASGNPVATGESDSIEINQEVYMIPNSLLKNGVTNPVYGAKTFECDVRKETFYGYYLLKNSEDSSADVYVSREDGGRKYYYFYFKDAESLAKYFKTITDESYYNSFIDSLVASHPELDAYRADYKKMRDTLANGYSTFIASSGSDISFTSGSTLSSYMDHLATNGFTPGSQYDTDMEKLNYAKANRYKAFYALLYDLSYKSDSELDTPAKLEAVIPEINTLADNTKTDIFRNFINYDTTKATDGFRSVTGASFNGLPSGRYHATSLNDSDYHMVAENNNGLSPLVIGTGSGELNYDKGIIVASGDVVVKKDFDGIIFANGNVYIQGDNVEISNSLAGSVSTIINHIQSASKVDINGDFIYFRDIFLYWNSGKQEVQKGSMKLSDMTYKDMLSFYEWRKYMD